MNQEGENRMQRRCFPLVLASAALLFALAAYGQTPTGAIEGTVTDQTGAAVPGAKVTITEQATGRAIPLTTNELGRYSLRNLLPGTYDIKVEAPSFSTRVINSVQVNSGAVVNGDVRLEVGGTEQVLQVTAEAVQVDTSRQTVDSIVTQEQIKNMPLFSRNFLDLAAMAPGVVIRDGGSIDPTKEFAYRTVGVNGRSGTGTRIQIDGIDVTDETVGTTLSNISDEAVNEFQLTRSSLDISTSLTSSGAVNVITRSGTNDFHGGWFYDYYNQDMGARIDYNAKAAPFNRKRTGGYFGGPFKKDKLFWFANWERTYQSGQEVFTAPEFPKLNISQGFPVGLRYALGRVDWNVSSSIRLFYRFNHDWNIATGGTPPSPFQNLDWTNVHVIGFDINKARATNSIRFGYLNFNNGIISQELSLKFPTSPQGIPYHLTVGSYDAGPNGLAPQATYQDNFQTSYDGSFVTGRHVLRYGLSFTHLALGGFANFAGPLTVGGTFDEQTIADVIARGGNPQDPLEYPFEYFSDGPANGFFTLRAGHGLPHGDHPNNRTAFFVGDSIKVSRGFTLNLGLRWEYDSGYFNNDRRVKRDPILETWGKGFSEFPNAPKNLFSPSIGFAWSPTSSGKTVIRGGFYKAYEMNINNNLIFDEFSMLPAGLGPDVYDHTFVSAPDGTPINVANHPDGDYSDLVGQPIKDVIGLVGQIDQALKASYAGYQFDPGKGDSAFRIAQGLTFGGTLPGNQFKVPYAIQLNIGVQRELKAGTVLTVDYVHNHGIGLPFMLADFERRRDAATLNVDAARARINGILGGLSVDDWMAAHPSSNISAFGLARDTVYQGLTSDFTRARLFQGGFTKYKGIQANLRGRHGNLWKFRDLMYNISYAYGRGEATASASRAEFLVNTLDNRRWNNPQVFGPTPLDYTHILTAGEFLTTPGGFRLNTFWRFRTPPPITLAVPGFGGPVAGANAMFGTDVNGDGGTGSTPRADVMPGMKAGGFGRDVRSFSELNNIINQFNSQYAGNITPSGQALVAAGLFTEDQLKRLGAVTQSIPAIPGNAPNPWHNLFTTDLRIDRPIKFFKEGWRLVPYADIINLFNHNPSDIYGGLGGRFGSYNFDYAAAPAGQQASDLNASRHRINPGLAGNRLVQVGIRFDF
jgi:hypothetical protein